VGRSLTAAGPLSEVGTYHQHPADTAAKLFGGPPGYPDQPGQPPLRLSGRGRPADAVPRLEATLRDLERLLGADHPRVAVLLYRLGTAETAVGDPRSAVTRLRGAARIDQAAYGPVHPEVATDFEALAAAQQLDGDVPAARRSIRHALNIRNASDPVDTEEVRTVQRRLEELTG
jgi:hypothetical protein